MKMIPMSEAKNKLSSIVEEAANTPVVLTRNGKAVAVIIAPENDADLERLVMSRSKRLQRLLSESREQIALGEVLTADQLFAHLKP
jgi:prevent-host-death family protein